MLERSEVKKGQEYILDGKLVTVSMIHKPCSGEAVSLCDTLPPGCKDTFPYLRNHTMQMRKFQKAATLRGERDANR